MLCSLCESLGMANIQLEQSSLLFFPLFSTDTWWTRWPKPVVDCIQANVASGSWASFICSIHFEKDCMVRDANGAFHLTDTAVPTKLLPKTKEVYQDASQDGITQNTRGPPPLIPITQNLTFAANDSKNEPRVDERLQFLFDNPFILQELVWREKCRTLEQQGSLTVPEDQTVQAVALRRFHFLYFNDLIHMRVHPNVHKVLIFKSGRTRVRLWSATIDAKNVLMNEAPAVLLDILTLLSTRDYTNKYAFLAKNQEFQCWELIGGLAPQIETNPPGSSNLTASSETEHGHVTNWVDVNMPLPLYRLSSVAGTKDETSATNPGPFLFVDCNQQDTIMIDDNQKLQRVDNHPTLCRILEEPITLDAVVVRSSSSLETGGLTKTTVNSTTVSLPARTQLLGPMQFQRSPDSQPLIASNSTTHMNRRSSYPMPAYSYTCLIALALKNSRTDWLPLTDIFDFMIMHFPFFSAEDENWKRGVRLALMRRGRKFEKAAGSVLRGHYWRVIPAIKTIVEHELQCQTKMNLKVILRAIRSPGTLNMLLQGKLKIGPSPFCIEEFEEAQRRLTYENFAPSPSISEPEIVICE